MADDCNQDEDVSQVGLAEESAFAQLGNKGVGCCDHITTGEDQTAALDHIAHAHGRDKGRDVSLHDHKSVDRADRHRRQKRAHKRQQNAACRIAPCI